ncbi:MAG: hypothetical protein HC925_06915 [Coleofasciculaceae cyanobacterium SM2_3_26]|nr:hypothetical protein [Coleofasciculaceae cyanobacterium SM2_3_26]
MNPTIQAIKEEYAREGYQCLSEGDLPPELREFDGVHLAAIRDGEKLAIAVRFGLADMVARGVKEIELAVACPCLGWELVLEYIGSGDRQPAEMPWYGKAAGDWWGDRPQNGIARPVLKNAPFSNA